LGEGEIRKPKAESRKKSEDRNPKESIEQEDAEGAEGESNHRGDNHEIHETHERGINRRSTRMNADGRGASGIKIRITIVAARREVPGRDTNSRREVVSGEAHFRIE
jgi:hypothetical protein